MGKDWIENSPLLWAKGLSVRARNWGNPKRNGKIVLLKWRRTCGLSNLPWLLATSNHQVVLPHRVQVTINLKSNSCLVGLNQGLSCEPANQIMVLQETIYQSLLGLPGMLLYFYWHTELYLEMWSTRSAILYLWKTLEQNKTYLHCTIRAVSKWITTFHSIK